MLKQQRKISEEEKSKAVAEYMSGDKSAVKIAMELGVHVSLIYKWKSDSEAKARTTRIDDLVASGATRAMAIKIDQQAEEIAMYQKKVAELTIINDLLKKLQTSTPSVRESELTGLIGITKKLDQKQRHVR